MTADHRARPSRSRTRGPETGEEGRIGMLLVGCVGVVVMFVLVSAAITSVVIDDRRLVACADRVAAAAAGSVDGRAFYDGDDEGLAVSTRSARRRAEDALDKMLDSTCSIGEGAALVGVEVVGDEVVVSVEARPLLALVPRPLSGAVTPILVRSSSAVVR
ncbi:hypothetical protein M3T53_08815 [Actinomyces sp. B33]|uniref:hypothetical protein n=1 Tax=Actinomyces sp. B33 TaxID=2942131 RepID=UPI0023416D02|nr:hypothetical protein [Actinomyces sp. B33]MDC4233803.1 hypothetical protein [Actinomyces sp. B33]